MATTFPYYSKLPTELQRQIWEESFEPRVLKLSVLTRRREDPVAKNRWQFQYQPPPDINLGGEPLGGEQLAQGLAAESYVALLGFAPGDEPEPIAALSVCPFSRDITKAGRYRVWKITDYNGKTRDFMWDPNRDTLLFNIGGSVFTGFINPLPLMERQYPVETAEAKYIILPTSLWRVGRHTHIELIWPLIDFLSLRELAVLIDRDHEEECIKKLVEAREATRTSTARLNQSLLAADRSPWVLPSSVERMIDRMREHYEKWGLEYHPLPKKAEVRTVQSMQGVLDGKRERVVYLRCSP